MKKITVVILTLIFVLLFPVTVFAQSSEDNFNESEEYNEIVDKVTDGIGSASDDEVNKVLDENEIKVDDNEGVSKISAKNIIKSITESFVSALKSPIKMLGKIIAISVLCMLAQSLAPEGSSVVKCFKIVSVLCSVTVVYETIYSSFELIKTSLDSMSAFLISYVPIFASITASCGNITTGGSYYAGTLLLCEIIGLISSKILMPFLSVVLSISLVTAINPELNFCNAANSIKKCVQWILGGLMTIFTGLLTIQSITGSATDSLTSKTLKFAASSFIPIVGGAVSEAYSTVYGSLGVIRSGAGIIGIVAICVIVIKPIINILAIKFVISIGKIINDMFGQKESSEFLNSINAVLSIGLGIVICFSLIFIISTAVLMMTAMNVVT